MTSGAAQSLPPKRENPFNYVPYAAGDISGVDRRGGGGKEFVPVTVELRQHLSALLDDARGQVAQGWRDYPTALAPLVFKLRDEAIAKSHRPTDLVAEAGLQPAGQERLNEMVVAGNETNLELLRKVIAQRDTKAIRANLSTIVGIEGWSQERRVPEGTAVLRRRESALIRIFKYYSDEATFANWDSVVGVIEQTGLQYKIIRRRRGPPLIQLVNLQDVDAATIDQVLRHPGIRTAIAEPMFGRPELGQGQVVPLTIALPAPAADLPTVAVFDSGVGPQSGLQHWIVSSDAYVLPPDTNHMHGTAVSSLVTMGALLNNNHDWLPSVDCLVHDVAGLETGGTKFTLLDQRLREAIQRAPHVKVWNVSIGAPTECSENEFSWFAQQLDGFSDEFGVLFVVSAGNYLIAPRRGWPDATVLADRICEPADSVRALTVGSIAHDDHASARVTKGSPNSYSRRGPAPLSTPKPDIVHVGGGVHNPFVPGATSVSVLAPNGLVYANFGTSFAAPVASSMAAHVWASLQNTMNVQPSMVKAFLIHAAQLSSPDYLPLERRYYGAGIPIGALAALHDRDDSFTLVFEARLVTGAFRWRKAPFPIPASLLTADGRFRGEIIITAAYAPPVDGDAGAEYVRSNVEISFGTLDDDHIKSKVPVERELGSSTYEKQLVEHGGKWSPVKLHRKRFSQGIGEAGSVWALQATCSLREFEPPLLDPIDVTIIVTMRAIDGDDTVYSSGVRALAASNWVSNRLVTDVPIRV